MDARDITAVGRLLDTRYPTNLAIAIVSTLVTVAGAAWQWLGGTTLLDGALWGISAGLAVFLAWALARELDPDHDRSAFVGAGLVLVALPFLGLPQLLPLFWIIVAIRIVNRTVGLPARPLDSLALVGLGLWLTWQEGWIYGLATAAALFLDGWLEPPLRRHLLLSGVVLVVAIPLAILRDGMPRGDWNSDLLQFLYFLAGLMFLLAIETMEEVRARCDATDETVRTPRVRAAGGLGLVTGLLFTGQAGQAGLVALLPLWATMLGVALYHLGSMIAGARQAESQPDTGR